MYKLRTFLTGFGVMWAMMVLVLLEAASVGFYKGMAAKFKLNVQQYMRIYPGYIATGPVRLTENLATLLAHHVCECEVVVPIFCNHHPLVYDQKSYSVDIFGIPTGYAKVEGLTLDSGRWFTQRDGLQDEPICILGSKVQTEMFGTRSALGKYILVGSQLVCVVGVLAAMAGSHDNNLFILPTVFKRLFPEKHEQVDHMVCQLKPNVDANQLEKKIRNYCAKQLNFDQVNKVAMYIENPYRVSKTFKLLFKVIQGFIWFITGCFLVSGVVGISNMMLVVVRERTPEFIIRKILGASNASIIRLILSESVVISMLAGLSGMGIGLAAIRLINTCLSVTMAKQQIAMFEFHLTTALVALIILILAGCVAAIIPIKRAICIQPIDALNYK
ncbi:MAG: ABC transporter permease [Amoebophilaceae bacterium]|nr:ABC transporter permease [Amoebophilaceae bacterium]